MISVVINTCAGGWVDTRSTSGQSHLMRAYALQNIIIPRYLDDPFVGEVIIVGEWKESPNGRYQYIHQPSVYRSAVDALHQRHAGALAAQGDTLIFQHDDHMLAFGEDIALTEDQDVLCPRRVTFLRNPDGERLNNGEEGNYVTGHFAIYRREVIQACPWDAVPKVFTWDIQHTQQITAYGYSVDWNGPIVYDIEHGAQPWR